MKNLCWIFAVLLSFVSCGELSDRARLQKIVEEWQGRQIILPESLSDFLTGDTLNISDLDFTILTYIDSTGCTDCKMNLNLWNRYLTSLDTLSDTMVDFIMVVNTRDADKLDNILTIARFDYPVFMDMENKVDSINKFPNKQNFRTFLLDKNRKVLLMGNPLISKETDKLYRSFITGKLTQTLTTESAVSVSENVCNLGNIEVGQKVSRKVRLNNLGNETVKIVSIDTSCECIEINLPYKHISPRSSIDATINFKGDSVKGEFLRTIRVYYKDFEYPSIITVTGNII